MSDNAFTPVPDQPKPTLFIERESLKFALQTGHDCTVSLTDLIEENDVHGLILWATFFKQNEAAQNISMLTQMFATFLKHVQDSQQTSVDPMEQAVKVMDQMKDATGVDIFQLLQKMANGAGGGANVQLSKDK